MKQKILQFLKWSQKYTETDMIYLTKGGFWLSATKIVGILIALSITIAFANLVPKEVYGTYGYILSITAIIGIFTLSGLNSPFIRAIIQRKEGMLIKTAKIRIKWGLISSILSLIISFWYFIYQNNILGISFLIAAVFLPFFETFDQLTVRFWQARKQFFIYSVSKIIPQFLSALGLILVIFLTNNLILIILAFFLSQTIWSGIIFLTTLKKTKNNGTETETLKFGKHLTVIQGIEIFGKNIDKIIIWHFLGPASVAIYSFAQLPILKIQEMSPIQSLALIKLSEGENLETRKIGIFKKFKRLFFLIIPLIVLLIIAAPFVYQTLFPVYISSVPYFQALTLLLLLSLPFLLFTSAFLAQFYKKELYIITISNLIARVILFLILVPPYGIWGVVISLLIAQLLNDLLLIYFFKRA